MEVNLLNLNHLLQTLKENQLLAAGIGLGGAGLMSFWLKDVPKFLFNYIKRMSTTTLTITSQHLSFYNTLKWIEINYKNTNFRNLKLNNGKYGENDAMTSIGYGIHYIFYKRILFIITLTKDSQNQSCQDKDIINITKIGRNRKIFDNFIKEINSVDKQDNLIKIYKFSNFWEYIKKIRKRNINNIFIEKSKKDELMTLLNNFVNNEDWYIENEIPYQLGILLHGTPGSGKSSLIRAMASYLNYPIYYISMKNIIKIEEAMNELPNKSIVVIEDIDTNSLTHSRDKLNNKSNNVISTIDDSNNDSDDNKLIGLSEILNSIDGILSSHGRILVMTTNYIEKLDEALIRPGRIDLQLEMGFANMEILQNFINKFYPNNNMPQGFKIKSNISVATLQDMMLKGYDFNTFIKKIKG
jgi:chaperone BCS1